MEKIFIDLPYSIRTDGKSFGAEYDKETKQWYILNSDLLTLFELVDVNVPFEKAEFVKLHGGIFKKDIKQWKTCRFNKDKLESLLNDAVITSLIKKTNELKKDPINILLDNIKQLENQKQKIINALNL
jgi:hypothetical protein